MPLPMQDRDSITEGPDQGLVNHQDHSFYPRLDQGVAHRWLRDKMVASSFICDGFSASLSLKKQIKPCSCPTLISSRVLWLAAHLHRYEDGRTDHTRTSKPWSKRSLDLPAVFQLSASNVAIPVSPITSLSAKLSLIQSSRALPCITAHA